MQRVGSQNVVRGLESRSITSVASRFRLQSQRISIHTSATDTTRESADDQAFTTSIPENKQKEGTKRMGYWQNKANVLRALDRAEQKLDIRKPEDWLSVTLADLRELDYFPKSLSRIHLAELLGERYPLHNWKRAFLLKGRYSQQKRLERVVGSLFPDVELLINARKEGGLVNPSSGVHLEMDLYLPSLKLAFEYQEKHHYVTSGYDYQNVQEVMKKDQLKKELANDAGITLITVPCWWDRSPKSLIATIKKARSDLLTDFPIEALPIPEDIPQDFMNKHVAQVEGVGEPINASFFTLSKIDPTGWWMFEKYDGVRGFWNPVKKTFFSRHGKPIPIPETIAATMPSIFLDGEIWFGKENFQEAMKVVARAAPSDINWSKFKYMAFDLPDQRGTYAERYNLLVEELSTRLWPHVDIARMEECKNIEHLEKYFQDIVDSGGEGVILRDPKAPYQPGRSPGYLKHKKFRDAEAKIIGPAGLYQWECEMPNGVKFTAPAVTTEFTRRFSPEPGDIVSFKHRGFITSTMRPKFPSIYRLRHDVTWEDVVNNWRENKRQATAWPIKRVQTTTMDTKDLAKWREDIKEVENRKQFFKDLAEQLGFGVLDVNKWAGLSLNRLYEVKWREEIDILLQMFGSLKEALQQTFEELKSRAWPIVKNRKR